MLDLLTGPGSGWTYLVLGLVLIGIVVWAYRWSQNKDKKPKWLKSSKATKKLLDGFYIITNIHDNYLELAVPETEKLVVQNSHYQYAGKPLSECSKIIWELNIPYTRYDHKVNSLIIKKKDEDKLTLCRPYYSSSMRDDPVVSTGKLVHKISF